MNRRALASGTALALALAVAVALAASACGTGAPAQPVYTRADEACVAAGGCVDAGSGQDAGTVDTGSVDTGPPPNPCADAGYRGEGGTFTDLYRDFFGPPEAGPALASCAARPICHVPKGTGELITHGYQCFPDQATCWKSMTSTIVPMGGSASPEDTTLYKALRKGPPSTTSGPMPKDSEFTFCADDLARIRTWIANGAKND